MLALLDPRPSSSGGSSERYPTYPPANLLCHVRRHFDATIESPTTLHATVSQRASLSLSITSLSGLGKSGRARARGSAKQSDIVLLREP